MNFFFFIFNILFIIINIYSRNEINENNSKKYLEFSFSRNLTLYNSLSPEELFESLFYNQIYISMKVGTEKIEIPFYFYLQQYSMIVQSSNVSSDQVKGLYNERKSNKYSQVYLEEDFMVIDMSVGISSKDIFFINNQIDEYYFNFYLCIKNHDNTHIPEGGRIGFKFEPECLQDENAVFIKNLKKNNLISELIFSFKYDSETYNEDKGKFYIGTYPHIYDDNHYNFNDFINENAENFYNKIEWALKIDQIKLDDNIIENNNKIFFYIEIGYIVSPKKFFKYILSLDIWKKYFINNKKCHETKFVIDDFEKNDVEQKLSDEYTLYYCDKDVDITKINIGQLNFINKNMNFSFSFSNDELWTEQNGYKYFKILNPSVIDDYWFFGKPFFKKYQMIFDYDNKKVGIYTQILNNKSKEKEKNFLIYILAIIGLCIIVFGLGFILIKTYNKLPRKKKANELIDEDFDYETKNQKENEIIN